MIKSLEGRVMDDDNNPIGENAVWGGLATLAWGLLVTAIFMATQMLVMSSYIALNYDKVSGGELASLREQLLSDGTLISLATISTFIVGSLTIVGIVKIKKYSQLNPYLGLTLPNRQQTRYWLTFLISLLLLLEFLSYFIDKNQPHEFMVSAYTSATPLWLLWIAMVVAAPIYEELFFRGFLLEGFRRTFLGSTGAVVLTSILWAVVHTQYDVYYMTIIFVMGLVLGLARVSSGSVVLTIGLHALVNGLATMQMAYSF